MSLSEYQNKAELVGTHAIMRTEDNLMFGVRIQDVSRSYGRWRFLIKPTDGLGEKWVDEARLTLADGAP